MIHDTTFLSRLQFAFTISFHILFPAFSIGLAVFLSIMEGLWLKTKNTAYLVIAKFWTKIFALTFGMGVVSGIVMEFQFGTNWSGFAHQVGGVLGALFTYEVMTAFFIEAGFLGVMLFGWDRVGPKLHYLATLLVTIGTTVSAYWILAANSWMQHPVGFRKVGAVFQVTSWSAVIFNSATFPRFFHMLLAAYLCAAFVIISVSAYYLLNNRHKDVATKCFRFTWLAVLIIIPAQIFIGDMTGEEVLKNQPIKTAAMEGIWNTQRGAPYLIFAIPDSKAEKNIWSISIPHGAALINTHQWNGKLIGLKSVAKNDRPNVPIVFFSFRIMVYVGLLIFALALIALYLRIRKKLDTVWFQKISLFSAPLGFIALWCGWIAAEVGRQPWAVYHLLRTINASSKVPVHDVIVSFGLIIIVYGVIFGYFYFYFLNKVIKKGPQRIEATPLLDQPFSYMSGSITEDKEK